MNQAGLELAARVAQPTQRVVSRAQNCNCPEDLGPFTEESTIAVVELVFPDQGCLQRRLFDSFDSEAMGQCAFCGTPSMVRRTVVLSNPSQVLVLSVNRVRIISRGRVGVNTDEFLVPDILEVPTLQGLKPYKLVAAVQHSGSASSGHYVSHLKLPSGAYIKVDDDKRIVPSPENAIRRSQLFVYVESLNASEDEEMLYA